MGRTSTMGRRLRVPRSSLLVPAVAAVAGLAFLAWKPGVARSMLGSPRALGFTVMVGVLVLALGWSLPRHGAGPRVTVAAQLVPALLAAAVTVVPAFRSVTVQEGVSPQARPVAGAAALTGIDHAATGRVVLLQTGPGRHVVRLLALDVEPGPDYHVYLAPGPDRRSPQGATHLGPLRGNRGSQNYPVPSVVAANVPVTVLIWCRAFAVPVAAATIR